MQALGCISFMCVVVKQDDLFALLWVLLTVAVGNRYQLSVTCSYRICRQMAPLLLALSTIQQCRDHIRREWNYMPNILLDIATSWRKWKFHCLETAWKSSYSLQIWFEDWWLCVCVDQLLSTVINKLNINLLLCRDLVFITMIYNLRYSRIRTGPEASKYADVVVMVSPKAARKLPRHV